MWYILPLPGRGFFNAGGKESRMKRYVVNESEGVKGKLPVPGGGGTFNILIDEEMSGAKHFSLLVNEMAPGYKGKEHSNPVEHCWYVLGGTGIIRMAGETYHISPAMPSSPPSACFTAWNAPEPSLSGMWSFTPRPVRRRI
jgi:mannose-6-phosphate isomerase-like protein (cupin superfamily)